MHDDESSFRVSQDLHVDAVRTGDLLVLLGVGEPLLLDSGDVEDIGFADHLFEAVCRPERETLLFHPLQDFRRHLERRWADEGEVGAEFGERICERMDRPAVLEVPDQDDVLALERTFLVPDRVQVEESLGRMLACAVARVDDRLLGEVRGEPGRAFVRMAQDDGVAVCLDHADRVGEGLAFLDGGPLGAAESEGTPAKPRNRPRPAYFFGSLRPNWVTFEGRITIPPSASMYRFQSFVFSRACLARSTAIVATTFRTTSSTSTPRISRNRYFIRSRSMVSRTIRGGRI